MNLPLRPLFGFLALAVGCALSSHAQILVTRTNSQAGLFDSSSGTRNFVFNAADLSSGGPILDVNLRVSFLKADGEGPELVLPVGTPYFNEVDFSLTNNAGTSVHLIRGDRFDLDGNVTPGSFDFGASGSFFDGSLLFDDAAAQLVNVDRDLIQAGTFKPVESLSAFNGSLFGPSTWTLAIADTAELGALRFRSATLEITYQGPAAAPVPEPSTYGLLAGGLLLGAIALRRRRR